jgi:hypothetical protein
MTASNKINRVMAKVNSLRNATRVWNWIDSQANPEPMWAAMLVAMPWAFRDQDDVNSIIFTY